MPESGKPPTGGACHTAEAVRRRSASVLGIGVVTLDPQFPLNDFFEGNVSGAHTRLGHDQWTTPVIQLSHSPRHDIDEDRGDGDYFCGFFH